MRGRRQPGIVVGVMMHRRRGVLVDVVRRVPAGQRARQDENDRECGKRSGTESQPTITLTDPGAGDKSR